MERKGVVIFYLNIKKEATPLTFDDYVALLMRHNSAVIEQLKQDGYSTMFVPTFEEACRVEKIDMTPPITLNEEL
jgi:hypothetical protein